MRTPACLGRRARGKQAPPVLCRLARQPGAVPSRNDRPRSKKIEETTRSQARAEGASDKFDQAQRKNRDQKHRARASRVPVLSFRPQPREISAARETFTQ